MGHRDGFDCHFCDGHCEHIEDIQEGGEFKSSYTCNNEDCNVGIIYIYWEVSHDDFEEASSAVDRHTDCCGRDLDTHLERMGMAIETGDCRGVSTFREIFGESD